MKIDVTRLERMRKQKQMSIVQQLLEEVQFYQKTKEDQEAYIKELIDNIIYHKEELQEAQLATSHLQEKFDNMKEKYEAKEKQVMNLVMANYKMQNEKLELYKQISKLQEEVGKLQELKKSLEKIIGIEL